LYRFPIPPDGRLAFIISTSNVEQDLMARELHNTAGIALQRCGIDEIKAFQTVLNGYQIHVLSKHPYFEFV
jgi:hypothetical protein